LLYIRNDENYTVYHHRKKRENILYIFTIHTSAKKTTSSITDQSHHGKCSNNAQILHSIYTSLSTHMYYTADRPSSKLSTNLSVNQSFVSSFV